MGKKLNIIAGAIVVAALLGYGAFYIPGAFGPPLKPVKLPYKLYFVPSSQVDRPSVVWDVNDKNETVGSVEEFYTTYMQAAATWDSGRKLEVLIGSHLGSVAEGINDKGMIVGFENMKSIGPLPSA